MFRKLLLMLSLCIACSIQVIAQTDYYYNGDKKIPLTLNENKVCISIPKDKENACERIRANVQILETIKDEGFNIFVVYQSEYEKLTSLDFWEEYSSSVILTSSYFTEENYEVFSTPYLNVELKRSQDADLLASYAEKYKLHIVGHDSLLTLWYILNVTPESDKSPLECANELWESGDFAASVPDLAGYMLDAETVESVSSTVTMESPATYDMQGRRVSSTSCKGLYISGGKKHLQR